MKNYLKLVLFVLLCTSAVQESPKVINTDQVLACSKCGGKH